MRYGSRYGTGVGIPPFAMRLQKGGASQVGKGGPPANLVLHIRMGDFENFL
jgi:hypothetical protein